MDKFDIPRYFSKQVKDLLDVDPFHSTHEPYIGNGITEETKMLVVQFYHVDTIRPVECYPDYAVNNISQWNKRYDKQRHDSNQRGVSAFIRVKIEMRTDHLPGYDCILA